MTANSEVEQAEGSSPARYPLSHHDTHLWAFQLHIMLSAGITVVSSLESLSRSDLPALSKASDTLNQRILSGMSLSRAMISLRPVFSPLAINLVSIGEHSGKLALVLQRLASRASRRDKMERMVRSALAYPLFLTTASLGMALFMAFYMFPKILPFLLGLGVTLPWPTRFLIWGVEHLSSAVLMLTIVVVGAARMMSTDEHSPLSRWRDRILYEAPVIGSLNRNRVYGDCCSDLHLMLEAGCDLMTSLKAIHSSWPDFNQRKEHCLEALKAGANFVESVESSQLFPRVFYLQLSSAEETGNLPQTFEMLADQLDDMVSYKTQQLVSIVEPMVFLVMGVVTGFVVLATFLPMYGVVATGL